MNTPRIDYTISVGNLLTIVAGIAAFIWAWGELGGAVRNHEARIVIIEENDQGHTADIRTLQIDGARTDERYTQLLAMMSRIDQRTERLEQRGARP